MEIKILKRLEKPTALFLYKKSPHTIYGGFFFFMLIFFFVIFSLETNNPPQIMMSAIAIMIIALVDILFFSLCLCEIFPR